MSRKPGNANETKLPSHDLLVKFTHEGQEITLGRIGLFTENNDLHQFIASLPQEKIETIHSKLSFALSEHGETHRNKRQFTADW